MPPPLHDVEELYWNAFWELSTDRQVGMSSGAIPWSSIARYSNHVNWTDMDSLSTIIRALDDLYLSHESEVLKGSNK